MNDDPIGQLVTWVAAIAVVLVVIYYGLSFLINAPILLFEGILGVIRWIPEGLGPALGNIVGWIGAAIGGVLGAAVDVVGNPEMHKIAAGWAVVIVVVIGIRYLRS